MQNLGRNAEVDDVRDAVVQVHGKNWRLLQAAAGSLINGESYGFIIAGKFFRGPHRGGDGRMVNSYERDRVRALKLMQQGLPHALEDDDKTGASSFLLDFAQMFMGNRGYGEAWRLQYLTDLEELPDYEDGWYYGGQSSGAPVDADGKPVFHQCPRASKPPQDDGQRWRWCLMQAVEIEPSAAE